MTDVVKLWRCERCGKWSHAKRKPKHHKRLALGMPDEGDTVLEYHMADPGVWYDGQFIENDRPDVYVVACGPFATYEAQKVES